MRAILAFTAVAVAFSVTAVEAKTERFYIGTFTAPANGRTQPGNRAEGIYVGELDTVTGKLSTTRLVAKTSSPTWLVYDKAKSLLYATNEYDGFTDPKTGGRSGSISVYRADKASGDLSPLPPVGIRKSAGNCPAITRAGSFPRFSARA